ncbi:MAG: sigma 54-interacting transcriptional regulator [Candidatus Eisenbacteria bacterium]|nr:sigma 54-interacting transcriptional regulator [Candidatus Eisenbacteria bacterium]
MTQDEKKRLIQREIHALERLDPANKVEERIERLARLADLYYSVDQFQEAYKKYHDHRVLAVGRGIMDVASAAVSRIKESWCLYERGELTEAERSLEDTAREIVSLPPERRSPIEAEMLTLQGYLEVKRGRYDDALTRCRDAFRLLGESRDEAALAKLQICYGHVYFRTGELDRAREFYEDGMASARRASDVTRQIQATINLALVCKEQSDNDRALALLEKAQEALGDTGNFSYRGHVLLNLAVIHFHRGDLKLSEESYRDALRVYMQTGQQQCTVLARIGLARIHLIRGREAEAKSLLLSTLQISRENGYLREEVLVRRDLGDVERALGHPEEALRLYEEALASASPLGENSEHAIQIGRRIGIARIRLGDLENAQQDLYRSLLRARRVGERYEEALLSCALGTLAALDNRWEESERNYHFGLEQLRRMGEKIELAKAMVRHVRLDLNADRGEESDKQLELAEARRIFHEAGVPLWLGKARLEEARLLARGGVSSRCENALAEAERVFADLGNPRLIDQVDQLRRSLEERIVERSLSRRNDHLVINDILPASSDDFDLRSLLEDLVARTDGDRGIVIVFGGEEGAAEPRALHGFQLEQAGKVVQTLRPVLDRCRRGGRPFLSTAVASDPRLPGASLVAEGAVRSLLVVPFQTSAEISGAIYLDREEHRTPYGSRALDLVVGLVRSQRFVLSLLSNKQKELMEENTRLRKQVSHADRFDRIITQSRRMDDVLDLVRKVAGTNVTVMIQGETGTGKQLIAQAVHDESPRRERTFYSINCATLPEQLLESELFGHASGSFTGAHSDKAGLLVEASGSTVFLDEIDKMNPRVQSKLLHVLEEKRIRPLGTNRYVEVDVRFICASNRELRREVDEGRFLEDLYYRLNVINIELPPLRERIEDILLLSQYFIRVFSAEMGKEPIRLDESAIQALMRHAWPGNVRELRSEMRRLVLLDETGVVTLDRLSHAIRDAKEGRSALSSTSLSAVEGITLREQMRRHEGRLLRAYLEKNGDNVSKTARELGLSRWGLHKKLEKYGLR